MAGNRNAKSESPRSGRSPDPYLRTFLRQAVAVIAAERGINDASYAKLQAMADQLGLSDSTFQAAIEKLKKPDSALGLNRYEKQFVNFLAEEFRRIRGDVLTVRAEARVIDLAESKYQIDAVRAHQLLRKTARQYEVGMISHLDAEQFVLNLIEAAAAQNAQLDQDNLNRLYRACSKWGFSPEDVDIALNARLARNRRKRAKSYLVFIAVLFGIAGFSAAILSAAAILDWRSFFVAGETSDVLEPAAGDGEIPTLPWWDDELSILKEQLSQQDSRAHQLILQLLDSENGKRAPVYGQLITLGFNNARSSDLINSLLARSFLLDPDKHAVEPILFKINDLLSCPESGPVTTAGRIRRSLTANRLLGKILERQLSPAVPGRLEAARATYDEAFGIQKIPDSLAEYERSTVPKLTANQWTHASLHSHCDPEKVAAFLPELEKRHVSRTDLGLNELRTPVLQNIIAARPFLWKSLQPSLEISIRNADTQKIVAWIDVLFGTADRSFSRFLLTELATKIELDLDDKNSSWLLQQLRDYRTRYRIRGLEPAINAKNQLESTIGSVQQRLRKAGVIGNPLDFSAAEQSDLPELITAVARANNLAMAWSRSIDAQDFSDFKRFQQEPPPVFDFAEESVNQILLTPSERRLIQDSFDRLFQSDRSRVTSRISALQSLARTASRAADIDYTTAAKLATYLFQEKESREALAIERVLPEFSHWAQLKLAIADMIVGSDLDVDMVMNILNRIGIHHGLLRERGDWQSMIRREILLDVILQLEDSHRQSIEHLGWSRLEESLRRIYSRRMELINENAEPVVHRQLSDALIDAIRDWLSKSQATPEPERWEQSLLWIRSSGETESAKLVLINQILAEVWSSRGQTPIDFSINPFALALRLPDYNNGQRLLMSELLLMDDLSQLRKNWEESIKE